MSEGWRLFGENRGLAQPRRPRDGVTTPFGRIGGGRPDSPAVSGVSRVECEAHLRVLARLDHSQRLRDMSEAANRSLAAFYPVNAAGLGVSAAAGSDGSGATASDAAIDSLRFLADNTGGTATLWPRRPGGLAGRLQAEGAPYYLVRYRSSNTKLDGRFRALSARTTRPDVRLRVRRGYRGPTPDELLSDRAARRARDRAASAAEPLHRLAPSFRIRTAAWASTDGGSFWLVGELDPRLERDLVWTAVVKAEVTVVAGDGSRCSRARWTCRRREQLRAFACPNRGDRPTRITPCASASTRKATPVALTDTAAWPWAGRRGRSASRWLAPGPTTGRAMSRRPTRASAARIALRLEFATRLDGTPQARLVDRTGSPLQVPVAATSRADTGDEGLRWVVAEVTLAPLASGDYEIELELAGGVATSFAFSVVP